MIRNQKYVFKVVYTTENDKYIHIYDDDANVYYKSITQEHLKYISNYIKMGFGVFEAGASREKNVEYVRISITKTEKLKEWKSMLNDYQKEIQNSKAWEEKNKSEYAKTDKILLKKMSIKKHVPKTTSVKAAPEVKVAPFVKAVHEVKTSPHVPPQVKEDILKLYELALKLKNDYTSS
jgi:hypothetical protein